MSRWKIDYFLIGIIILGIIVFAFKCKITYPIKWIGDTDEAVFAEMADSFVHGKGLSDDFIQYSYFYSPQPRYPEITHPDAHYPPLYPLLIAPFYLIFGKTAFAAKLPAMLTASLFLPLFLYLLTKRLSRSRVTGLAAALGVVVFPNIFSHSLIPDDDGIFPFMVLASCYFIMMAMDSPKYFYPAGIFIGLSYYAKGSGLYLIPAYLLFCVIWGGLKILRNRKMWYCFAIVFLIMLPWFIRNTIYFRNPIFSTQQYAAGYIGYKGWEEGTYSLYWDKERPTLFSKFKQAGAKKVWEKSKDFFKAYLWWSFVDIDKSYGEFEAEDFYTYYTGIPAAAGLFLFFLSYLYLSFNRLFAKDEEKSSKVRNAIGRFLTPWHKRDYHALWSVGLLSIAFLSICWEPIERLAFPFILLNMAIGWTTYHVAATQIFKRIKYSNIIVPCLIALLMFPILWKSASAVYDDYKDADYPYGEDGQSWMETGKWIKENIPGSITMFREPAQLHFYSEEKTIQAPLARLDQIIKVMKFYKVTHIIPKVNMRPALKPLVEGKSPGFKLVYDKGLEVYEIQYALLPSD
ncbi:MAG: ArnT family glycosyltransferase [Candidatus Poribacteria bacterium]